MKKLGVIAVVIALTGVIASADMIVDPPLALKMVLSFDAAGNASITNQTGAPVEIDAYEIWSAGSNLDPVGWESIADAVLVRSGDFFVPPNGIGAGALSFGELTATPALLAEGSLSAAALFGPGATWTIGQPIEPGTAVEDLSFWYSLKPEANGGEGTPGNKYLGEVVPEPATMGLLVFGGLGLLARRRR